MQVQRGDYSTTKIGLIEEFHNRERAREREKETGREREREKCEGAREGIF
jgi:hypothetical protein